MKILIADDVDSWRKTLTELCKKNGHEVCAVSDGAEIKKMPDDEIRTFHLALLDYKMPVTDGLKTGIHLLQIVPDIMLVMLTGHHEGLAREVIVAAMREGFYTYLDKGNYTDELTSILNLATERLQLREANAALRPCEDKIITLDKIVGESSAMRELRQLIQTVAPTDARVLILGKSGTGKELVAGALHHLSRRREANYIRINCAAIPETLLESELFGHEKGAFTGALKQKAGRVEEANGGTIFLDEIADMSKPLQAKLLRFLEDGSFTRVGGTQELYVNVRLIAATNRDIAQAITDGQFREDLFHRLNVVQFRLPLLREREGDVLLLAGHFLKMFRAAMNKNVDGIAPTASQKLLSHTWPGNVRELRNVIERALILETTHEIQQASLPDFGSEDNLYKEHSPDMQVNLRMVGDIPSNPHVAKLAFWESQVASELDRLEAAMHKALEISKINGETQVRLKDLGKALNPPCSHVVLSNFFNNEKSWRKIPGSDRLQLITQLAKKQSQRWPRLRNDGGRFRKHFK